MIDEYKNDEYQPHNYQVSPLKEINDELLRFMMEIRAANEIIHAVHILYEYYGDERVFPAFVNTVPNIYDLSEEDMKKELEIIKSLFENERPEMTKHREGTTLTFVAMAEQKVYQLMNMDKNLRRVRAKAFMHNFEENSEDGIFKCLDLMEIVREDAKDDPKVSKLAGQSTPSKV